MYLAVGLEYGGGILVVGIVLSPGGQHLLVQLDDGLYQQREMTHSANIQI